MTGPQQPGDWHLHEHGDPARHQVEQGPADPAPGQSWTPPAADQRVPGRRPLTSRGRSWLLFLTAGCLVLIYMVIWIVYAAAHTVDRYVQLPPGQPSATSVTQAQYRLKSLVKTERINDKDDPDDPQIAEAGTIFVVAEFEVVRVAEDDVFYCQAELVVDGYRKIGNASPTALDGDPEDSLSCSGDDLKIGQPYRFQSTYTVPTRFADKIYGVAVTYTGSGAPYQVIRPPA